MKIGPTILKNFPAAVLGVIFALVSAASAHAQILLTVDITNPDAVVFTATGNGPSTSVNSYSFFDGVDLVEFFTSSVPTSPLFTADPTTLTTGDASSGPVFDMGGSSYSGSESSGYPDISLFSDSSGNTMSFTTGQPALSGSLTLNLDGEPLPAVGTSNQLLAGFIDSGTTPIGSYLVVEAPEPSAGAMIALGFIVLAAVRNRRARA